ncbi:filament-like plant protein 4 [Glycine soja]|uniref:Filament-like plant protein 4 n=2 Tax=Glycine soja TaxID=3848 RepID=A0A0B2PN09_GLYSO|nr:filament-like plant protein 4 [Glycine soja]XP_028234712.1 filament-like plant protein 4 [Glycine soja]KHN09099.1 Filament-like plant protein 4 [Glycine soja]RZC05440.1 Filament-like plant protein 4 isoform A [Glycine soja]RZC05441.1 Filament-like plant protein 4 isoform B [Glycine soja]
MDRRWPWKKKSSEKSVIEKATTALDSSDASNNQDNNKKPNYVQISVESYSHLSDLEDQVKTYEEKVQTLEDEIKEMNEKMSAANSEINTKESMVKQHAKVAEEAVSGWEKAEAEALALKNHLESVTLLKLTAEDRATHLDGALKECMRQIRNLKEEHEHKIQEVALSKTMQLDKIKGELEAKIVNFEQELLRSAAENGTLSRSLQERSNMLIKLSEEKGHAEGEIELLKGNIEACEREINSLKYELHVVSKELEIRNEEKNMSMRSAEAANKQHMEGVKKITKLEAECQRLRGLVRKKLPGPAALAQMKLEVESLGRDFGESRLRKSPVKPATPNLSPLPDFSLENVQKFQKDNEFLTERLLAMEEETKMLKEALAKRNSELQASRSMCAKTLSKLQSLEAQSQNQLKGSPKSIVQLTHERIYNQNSSSAPSLISMSEDGNDDAESCAESWATAIVSGLSQFPREKCNEESNKSEVTNKLELMDDFLEVEKLARLSNDSNVDATISVSSNNKTTDFVADDLSEVCTGKEGLSEKNGNSDQLSNEVSSDALMSAPDSQTDVSGLLLTELRSRILLVFESLAKDADIGKIVDDIKHVLEDSHDTTIHHSVDAHPSDTTCDRKDNPEDAGLNLEKEVISSQQPKEYVQITTDLEAAVSQIHDFVLFLGKEAMTSFHDVSSDGNEMRQKIEEFSVTFNKVLCNNASLLQFVLDLSYVLDKASEFRFNVLGYKGTEAESNSPDCIDKIALPENKLVQDNSSGERYQNGCSHILNPCSNPEVPDDGNLVSGYKADAASQKLSIEEFEELKLEKEKVVIDLSNCTENLEMTKSQLLEAEQLLAEVKSQLASANKSNSLAETQLRCMAESYNSLETRAQDLETELNHLQIKIESLENELQEEKRAHEAAMARSKELEEQLKRIECLAADDDHKTPHERNLTAAAEKLAECQETILLLGKQLNSLRPQTEANDSPYSKINPKDEGFTEDEHTTNGQKFQELGQLEMDSSTSAFVPRLSSESPLHFSNSLFSPSDSESTIPARSPVQHSKSKPKHRPTKSASSSVSSATTPEKHARGFSRFFSPKGKSGH